MNGYLGCDIGSVSLKMVVVDDDTNIIASVYLKNSGLVETIKKGLSDIAGQLEDVEIKSVGCAGSGREFTRVLLGGDITRTEILAHTIATMHYYPGVNTIFDIGGEDCKIITLKDGVWRNYIMNSQPANGIFGFLPRHVPTFKNQNKPFFADHLKTKKFDEFKNLTIFDIYWQVNN